VTVGAGTDGPVVSELIVYVAFEPFVPAPFVALTVRAVVGAVVVAPNV